MGHLNRFVRFEFRFFLIVQAFRLKITFCTLPYLVASSRNLLTFALSLTRVDLVKAGWF